MKKLIITALLLISSVPLLRADTKEDELKQRICSIHPSLDGWCSKEKVLSFIDLIIEVKPKVYVEIGVFAGSSLFPVATTLKYLDNGLVIGIDPWDRMECVKYFDPIKDKANMKWWNEVNLDRIYNSYLNMLRRYGLEEYVVTMKTTSDKAVVAIGTIDILYIDGNHSEVATTKDVELYLPKVRSGGYIWMNDSLWEDRQQAIELLLEACEVVKLIDNGNCILFKKS